MKFKTLFFLFNLILFVSFAFIFFMPLPVLGWEYELTFWAQNWPIAVLFVGVLTALDAYFLKNWRLFSLLEREDWPGLRKLLEAELAQGRPLGVQKTRILLNACLILQDPARISTLREELVSRGVGFLPKVALSLGLPLVLEGKSNSIEDFFAPLLTSKKTGPDGPWIRWCVAFGRLLGQDVDGAKPLLLSGAGEKRQPLLQLLSLYLLDNLRHRDTEVRDLVDSQRALLAQRWTPKEWSSHLESLRERVILVLFMEKLIGEALGWLRSEPQGEQT